MNLNRVFIFPIAIVICVVSSVRASSTNGSTLVGTQHTYAKYMKYSIEDLMHRKFCNKVSDDIDMDPSKWGTDVVIDDPQMIFAHSKLLKGERSGFESTLQRNRQTKIKQTAQHRRIVRAATAKKERIWDYGVIPYEIDANFSGAHKALFKQAMKHWENFTCIKFVERNPNDHINFILFTIRPCGCCSFVGKRGNGGQAISIGKYCDKFGIVVHELGHVVGFWHEHTRPDRDDHVVIERGNILDGQEYNFNKLTSADVNSLGMPYDFDSIMHYARNTFSKDTYLDAIRPIELAGQKRPEIGQRLRLSQGDIAQTNLLYKCPRCGRTFQENAASFTSPSYFSNTPSPKPESCEWRITATHGEKIVLNITDLEIFRSKDCQTDYLEIRDGYWHKSPILGRYCGSGKVMELIKSTNSRMLLKFVTTKRQIGLRGFAVSYEAVCGGDLNLKSGGGQLESPNYPLEYTPNKECIWRITVEEDFQVALKFQSFEVENHGNCVYDYVEVRDGDSADSRLIGLFCGYKTPHDVRSTSNKMFVKFVSDGSVQKAGFSATFIEELDECELKSHGCAQECINTLGGYRCSCRIGYELGSDQKSCEPACGGIIDVMNGTVTSPSFPDLYPISKNCTWEIVAPEQYRIILNFTHFDLEGNHYMQQECDYDSVRLHSKMRSGKYKRLGIFCGQRLPPQITSHSNRMRISFRSDNTVQKSGFAAIFITDIDECAMNNGGCMHDCQNTIGSYVCLCRDGFTLHENGHDCKAGDCNHVIDAPRGIISSPNYPDSYPKGAYCTWRLQTTSGHRVVLTFSAFDIEYDQECTNDYVTLHDGDTDDGFTLGRFCGSQMPYEILASNSLFMIFKSDENVQRKGFSAAFSSLCGGSLTASTEPQYFYSHARFGKRNYDHNADCEWVIETKVGQRIELAFLTFDVEFEESCAYDFVAIYGGIDEYSGPLFGRFCGTNKPLDLVSTSEALLIRFRSDATMSLKGFSVSYMAIPEPQRSHSRRRFELVTPFPGSFKSVYINNNEGSDGGRFDDHAVKRISFNEFLQSNKKGIDKSIV